MFKRIMMTITAAAFLMTAQPLLFAQMGPMKMRDGKGQGPNRGAMCERGGPGHFFGNPAVMQKELGLTDAQVTQIAGINKDFEKKMLGLKEKLAPMKFQLRKQLLEDTVDLGTVKSHLKQMADLKVELQMLKIQHRLDIEKILTPEQKAKLRQHRMHRMGKMGRGHGMMGL